MADHSGNSAGLKKVKGRNAYLILPDRREAITVALQMAEKGDVVLIAGKGMKRSRYSGITPFLLMIVKLSRNGCRGDGMIMEMDCRAVAAAVNGKIISAGAAEQLIRLLVIDSRQVEPGDFFIPLKGEHTDGHSFIGHAAERGAIGCFVSRTDIDLPPRITAIAVPDTLTALQSLARAYRRRFSLPVVGITGSVGKTTTKDLLSAFYRYATRH